MLRNLIPLLVALPLIACTPAGDKAATGEAIAEGAGVGDRPTGRVGDSVSKGAENGPIPANINEGLEPGPNVNRQAAYPANGVEPALPVDPPR